VLFVVALRFVLPLITDFEPEILRLAYILMLEVAPLILLITWTGLLSGAMNAYRRFAVPAVSPALRAVVALAVMFALKDRLGVHAVAVGYVTGELFRVLVLGALLCRLTPLRFRAGDFAVRFSPDIRRFLKIGFFQNVALLAVGLNPVVDRTMASWLPQGSVSVLYYADRLYAIPITLFLSGAMVALLAHWSSDYYARGVQKLGANVAVTVRLGAVFGGATALFLMALSSPLTRLAFGRGEFPPTGLPQVARVWAVLLAGLLPQVLKIIYAHALLTLKDTRSLMKSALYVNGMNIALNYALMWPLGVAGIALSTTLTQTFAAFYLRRRFTRWASDHPTAPSGP